MIVKFRQIRQAYSLYVIQVTSSMLKPIIGNLQYFCDYYQPIAISMPRGQLGNIILIISPLVQLIIMVGIMIYESLPVGVGSMGTLADSQIMTKSQPNFCALLVFQVKVQFPLETRMALLILLVYSLFFMYFS